MSLASSRKACLLPAAIDQVLQALMNNELGFESISRYNVVDGRRNGGVPFVEEHASRAGKDMTDITAFWNYEIMPVVQVDQATK
eukprot:1160523-Pelagomonas_calceolata.AAC.4